MQQKVNNFYELEVWKHAHELVLHVYQLTNVIPKTELFGIISQIKRAVTSITANIAEGFARFYYKDKVRFYYHARGSNAEVQDFLLICRDLGYIDGDVCRELLRESDDINRLLNGLIKANLSKAEGS